MENDAWPKVKDLLYEALQLGPDDRAGFLDKKCEGNEALRGEVESLLAAHRSAGSRFDVPAINVMAANIANGAALASGASLGHYKIIKKLGSGGMGDVYLAEDSRLDRRVAVKVLPDAFVKDEQSKLRFIQEAKAASALNHPNIITVYEIASDNANEYIAMEFAEGETVRDLIARGKVETRRAAEIVAQAAAGLAAAHDSGIVHRDIKPENLMVTQSSQVKILDFGLAKLVEGTRKSILDSSAETMNLPRPGEKVETLPGTILGTVAYMSPEQAEGRPLDRRSDIFSLGVVFYELITGTRPFEGNSAVDTLHSIINKQPRPARELNAQLPLEVEDLLGKALAKDPNERYQHAGDFELDLRRFKRAFESGSLLSSRAATEQPGHGSRKSSLLRWAAIAGLPLILVIAALLIWRAQRPVVEAEQRSAAINTTLSPVTVDPGFEGEPSFAPDGDTIAYVSDRTGNFEIFLRKISGGPDINLTNNPADDMQPAISPDGKQVAFVSARSGESDCLCFFTYGTDQPLMGGSIWVMPAFGGSPRKIVETGTFPSWSHDGSSIIFTRGPWYGQKLFKISAVGGEPQEIPLELKDPSPFIAYPSYSPDSRWIVFEAANTVFVVPAEGGQPTQIADGKHPVWSADTGSIIYTNVEAGKNYTLWKIQFSSADGKAGGSPMPLTVGRGRDTEAAVSPDGKLIAFAALDVSFNLESVPFDAESSKIAGPARPITSGSDLIYFFSSTGSGDTATFDSHRGSSSFIWQAKQGNPPIQLTADKNYEDFYPRVSPDGRTIAFNRKASEGSTPDNLWLMDADGANPRQLIEEAGFVGWMAGGTSFIYCSFVDGQLYLYDVSAKTSRQLTNEEGVFGGGVPSPDGKWVAFMTIAAGNIDIRAVPIEGGESIPVVNTPRQDFHPVFSPSGKWLYFQLDHKNIYRVPGPAQNWRKADPEKITNFAESGLFLEDPQISADGHHLLYSRRRTAGDIWVMKINQ